MWRIEARFFVCRSPSIDADFMRKSGKFFEYLHHFSDIDGNRVELISQGLSPEMPEEVRNLVTFKELGCDKTEVSVTEYFWLGLVT